MFTLAFNDELLYPPAWFWYMYTITTTYIGKIPNTKLCCIPFISPLYLFWSFPFPTLTKIWRKNIYYTTFTFAPTFLILHITQTSMFLRKLRQHLQPGRQILKLSSMWVLVFAAFLNSWKTNYKWQWRPNISRSLRGMVMVVEAFEAIEVKGNTVLPGYMLPIYRYVRQDIIRLITCFSNFWWFYKI